VPSALESCREKSLATSGVLRPEAVRASHGREAIDALLLAHLDIDNGVFVEAGAHDGISESNTLLLEREHGWSGLLIEPIPELADRCRQNRPAAMIEEVALVTEGHPDRTVEMTAGGLNSLVRGARASKDAERAWVAADGVSPRTLSVATNTLSRLLDRDKLAPVDLLSLDVEGYEPQALDGLDLRRHRPRFILIEVWSWTARAIADRLAAAYEQIAVLGHLGIEDASALGVPPGSMWEALYRSKR
jgi:FkbM family methyltransferase